MPYPTAAEGRKASPALAGALLVLCSMLPAEAAADTADGETPSSTETGQSPLDESFGPRTHADWDAPKGNQRLTEYQFKPDRGFHETAPASRCPGQGANWRATVPKKDWFGSSGGIGPLESWLEKSWRPREIEPVT